MMTLARTIAARLRFLPLFALALQACLPSLAKTEDGEPTEMMQSELEMAPDVERDAGDQEPPPGNPGGAGPDPVAPPGNGESPDDALLVPVPPLQLAAVTPANALIDVPVDAPLRISFAEPIAAASSASFSLRLLRSGSLPVAGETVLDGTRIEFRPTSGLALANSYTLVLEGTVRSTSGAQWTGREEASFETREGSWSAAQLLAFAGDSPRVGLDAAGNALAIWNGVDAALSGAARLAMAQYIVGSGWQGLPSLSAGCGPGCVPKFVAGGGNGDFQIAWASEGSLSWQLYHRDAGFEEAQSAAARGTDDAVGAIVGGQPWIAMHLPQGISVSYQGASGNAPPPYVTDSGLGRAGPVLVVDRAQSARVFWAEGANLLQLGPGADARPAVMTTWSANETIASITGASVLSGDALLAWETVARSTTDDSVLRSSLGVMFVAADGVTIDSGAPPVPEAGLGNRSRPAASLNDDGHALLAWLRTDGDPSDPLAATDIWLAYRSGVSRSWSEAVPLSLERAGIAHAPAVGIDSSGNGHGIWVETAEGGAAQLFGARLRAGTLSGSRFPISRDGAVLPSSNRNELSGDDNTRLVVDAAGRALALWVSPAGELWAARFE